MQWGRWVKRAASRPGRDGKRKGLRMEKRERRVKEKKERWGGNERRQCDRETRFAVNVKGAVEIPF